MRFRKKPPEVEAFRYDGSLIGMDGRWYVPTWAREAFENGTVFYDGTPPCDLYVRTPSDGMCVARVGDYIVRTSNGEIYAFSPDIFLSIYEYAGV